jgi:hypothetical protein
MDLNKTYVESSVIAIDDKYIFDSEHIEYLIDGEFLPPATVRVYNPNVSDMKEITQWMAPYFENGFVLVTDNNYTFAIQDDLPYNFNSDAYEFKEGDRRLMIKYVFII